MKILLVLPHLEGGGAERIAVNLANSLSSLGHEVTIFVVKDLGIYFANISDKVKTIIATNCKSRLDVRSGLIAITKLLIQANKHDIVIAGLEGWATILCYLTAVIANKPCIGWVHTSINEHAFNSWGKAQIKIIRAIYSKINAVVCVSRGSLQSLKDFVGTNGFKPLQRVIYNANAFPVISSATCRNNKTPIVLSAGRLYIDQKGFDILLEAHRQLLAKGISHKLVILGDGPDRDSILANIGRLGVKNSVELRGFQRNIVEWYDKSDVFVLASRYEGFGLVIVEALARGVPVVATDCDGPKEIFFKDKIGILVKRENVNSLAEGIELALTDSNLRQELIAAGLERAKYFTGDVIAREWEAFIEEVLNA